MIIFRDRDPHGQYGVGSTNTAKNDKSFTKYGRLFYNYSVRVRRPFEEKSQKSHIAKSCTNNTSK